MMRTWMLRLTAASLVALLGWHAALAGQPKWQSVRPKKIDLRPEFERRGLGVREQGQRGACQVFAFVGVIEFQLSKPGKPVDLSEQFLMWGTNDAQNFDRVDGFNRDWLITGLKKNGICLESRMPYVPRNEPIEKPSPEAIEEASKRVDCEITSIRHWSDDVGYTDDNIEQIMHRLRKKQPVTATLSWPLKRADGEIVDARKFLMQRGVEANRKNGHGVVLIGYVLDKHVEGGGFFIARNSWGEKFADLGCVGVTFDYAQKYGIDAYFVTLAPSTKR